MDIIKVRSQFSLYLITDTALVLEAERGLVDSGYRVSTMRIGEECLSRIRKDPAHVVFLDTSGLMEGQVEEFIQKIKGVSPETLIVVIVGGVDEGLAFANLGASIVHDFILRPLIRSEILLRAADLSCELIYQKYKIEQLSEIKSVNSADYGDESVALIQTLSSVKVLDTCGFAAVYNDLIAELSAADKGHQSLQIFLDLFYKRVEKIPLLYFKFVASPSSFVMAHSVGVATEKSRGIDFKLESGKLFAQEWISAQVDRVVSTIWPGSGFEKVWFGADNLTRGIMVMPQGFQSVQGRDLFYSLLRVVNIHLDFEKAKFENQESQVFTGTKLYNRPYFLRRLTEEVARCRRIRQPLTLINLRIDYYADYQRRVGKEMAQKLLGLIAEVLVKTSRPTDILADFQNGDFALLLPHTGQAGGAMKAEKIRCILESARIPQVEVLPHKKITLSQGISEYPGTSFDSDGLYKAADDALFYVYKNGGNQICLATALSGFRPDFEVGP